MKPLLLSILNVTPDSFSDGGRFRSVQDAVDEALRQVEEGADMVDVGGESTRPGAAPVPEDEEISRVVPVVEALTKRSVRVSVDTSKAGVARLALEAGAEMVNDVTALSDPEMGSVCASAGCIVCLMHMRGTPRTMQENPVYGDVVGEVRGHLLERCAFAESAGIAKRCLWIDPGIGFGKTDDHNLALLRGLPGLVGTGYPVMVGVSRKGFIGRLLAGGRTPLPVEDRLEGTLALQVYSQLQGVSAIRAHDVRAARRAIDITVRLS